MGLASVYYDVLNKITIDAVIKPKTYSERECAYEHLQHADQNDLVLFDRGYVGFWLYSYLLERQLSFCMRTKTQQDKVVKAFVASGKKEGIVTYYPNKPSIKQCHDKGLSSAPIKLRLVRIDLPNEVEVLITSLMDNKRYPRRIFKPLYHARWGIEENYKRLKQWVEIENFSGKSVLSVKQDFYAKIVSANLTIIMTIPAQKRVSKKTQGRRGKYQINYAQAFSKMKHRIVRLIKQGSKDIKRLICLVVNEISQGIEMIKKGRSYPRNMKHIKNDLHYSSYKSSL